MVVLAGLQHVGAEEQEAIIETLEHDPLNRLGPVRIVPVLLEGAEVDHVPLGRPPVGHRRVFSDEVRPALRRVRVAPEPNEDRVRARSIPGLGQAHRLRITLPALMVVDHETEGQREENRRECDGPLLDGCLGQASACHRSSVRPERPDPF